MRFKSFISKEIKPIYSKHSSLGSDTYEIRWDVAHFMRRDFDPILRCRIARLVDHQLIFVKALRIMTT